MSDFTFDDLSRPATTAEVRAKIYTILALAGTDGTSWKPGAFTRVIVAAVACIVAPLSRLVAAVLKSGFWQLSVGLWLTLCARYLCGVTRREATFAACTLTLINSGNNVYTDVAIDDVTVANADGKTFRNKAVFTLGALSTTPVLIGADEQGSGSTSPANTITTVVTAMPGVTCTNARAAVGLDEEEDAPLQRRCDQQAAAASPMGAREAFALFAMFGPDGNPLLGSNGIPVDVNRVHVNHSSSTNTVTVTVAGASGPVAGTYDDPDTDLGAIYLNLELYALPNDGWTLVVQSVSLLTTAVTWSLVVDASINLTDEELAIAAGAAIDDCFAAYPIGGYLVSGTRYIFKESIRSAIKAIDPKVLNVVCTGSDWTIAETQAPTSGVLTQSAVTRVTVT
jgi:hypothetical protein